MEKSTKASLQRIQNNFVLLFGLLFLIPSSRAVDYLDQIVLETPNAVKSVYDVRVFSFLQSLYLQHKIIDVSGLDWLKTDFESDRQGFIEQYLVEQHATEEETSLRPNVAEVQIAKGKIESVFKSNDEKIQYYRDLSITENDVVAWLEDRLTLENFLQTTIESRVIVTDQKVQEHYETWKKDRFANQSFIQIQQKVKNDLTMTLLDVEFQKWIDQEKRRRKLVVKSLKIHE